MASRTKQSAGIAEQRQQSAATQAALKAATNEGAASILRRGTKPRRQLTPRALQHWHFILDNVAEGQLLMTDIPLLEQYCSVLMKLEDLTEKLPDEDIETITARGTPVANPFFSVFAQLSTQATNLAQRLRLMPAMRQMSQREKEAQDPVAKPGKTRKTSKRQHLLFGGAGSNVVPMVKQDEEDAE